MASGSCSELEYQLLLARDLLYLSESIFSELTENVIEIRKTINSLSNKLN
ncbi:MAG: four helix bundle protein [Saprospiraceae bacterium]|nr:four helix bundle protein [Saprospiraceae bacterium]MBP8093909.1 four helix bundle protein [Saprospiraceae bacterium]MBP8942277.1 four helix bundle protein [Saprospiraceae bacterium]MBP9746484.1 four helix bundle protein [Saprospiraceae bacterium]